MANSTSNFVVFGVDAGIDDAWALLMLVKAELALNLVKILAITTVAGNTRIGNVTENTYRMLESVNRTDIPIYMGCPQAFIPSRIENDWYYGLDGFADVLPPLNLSLEEISGNDHAVNVMYEVAKKYPNQVSFVMAGPLTNLATAIVMHDDFLDKVKDIWILGGQLLHNYTKTEFNFRTDAVAAELVLRNAAIAKVPVYILPTEPCDAVNQELGLKFRLDYLGSVDSPVIHLLNQIEVPFLAPKDNWELYDPYLTAAFLFPEDIIDKSKRHQAKVKACDYDAGELLLQPSVRSNIRVLKKLNVEKYKQIIAWTAGVPDISNPV